MSNDNDDAMMAKVLHSAVAEDRWEAWQEHMRGKGLQTSREEFEKFEEEYRTAPTENELFTKYLQWCAVTTGRPLGDREAFVRVLRATYPKHRVRNGQVVYPGVVVKELFK